MFALSSICLKL